MINRLFSIPITLFVITSSVIAQDDSIFINDSFQMKIDEEERTQQTSPAERSPFLDVTEHRSDPEPSTQYLFRSRIESQLQSPAEYSDGEYPGSVLHSYQRLSLRQKGHLQAGLLFEKDPGEQSFTDFTAFHIMAENTGLFKKILLGDYLIEAGQGIALWRGYDYTKGKDVIAPVRRVPRLLVPYLSAGEQNYLSGGAVLLADGPVSTTLFVSRRTLSGSLDDNGGVKNIQSSGLYRTASERQSRDNTTENLSGFLLRFDPARGTGFGMSWYSSAFSRELRLQSPAIAGDRFHVLSFDFSVTRERMSAFGEWMLSNGEGGGIASVLLFPASSFGCIVSVRRYRHDWFSLHGFGFGEGSSGSDEEGWYLGTSVMPVRSLRVNIFFDRFRFAASGPGSPFSTGGREWEIAVDAIPETKLRWEIEVGQKMTGDESGSESVRSRLIAGVKQSLSDAITVCGRVENLTITSGSGGSSQSGRLGYAELSLRPQKSLEADFKMIMFRTDSFDARIAEYERNLDGALSIPSLSGDGVKWYLLLTWRISGSLSIQAKYSDLIRDDVCRIGTGPDQLPDNRDNRLAVQCDIRY